jgi:hypothetical protein
MITPADLEDASIEKLRRVAAATERSLNKRFTVRRGRNHHRDNVARREQLEGLLAAVRIELFNRGAKQ